MPSPANVVVLGEEATTRVDMLGPEHLLPVPDKNAARNRPDAVIEGVDIEGRARWLGLEVDLGHDSRARITGKVEAWRDYPDAATLVIVAPDEARRDGRLGRSRA